MDKSQRILEIDRRLRRGRACPFRKEDFAREIGVDERTIRRDLNWLRDQRHLPIEQDPESGGYYYAEAVGELPGTLISTSDRFALLLSLKAMEQYRATPLYEPLRAMYERLLALLPAETRTSYAKLASKIRFEGPTVPAIEGNVWQIVLNCLDGCETLQMTYHSGHDGAVRQCQVNPYGLIVLDRQWYLVGFDHLRGRVQTFALSRIQSADYTDRFFTPKDGFLDNYLSTAVDGQQSTGPLVKVKLRLSKNAPPALAERVWTKNERRSRDKRGRLVIQFETGAMYEVKRSVLAAGGVIELVEPAALRRAVLRQAETTRQLHQYESLT